MKKIFVWIGMTAVWLSFVTACTSGNTEKTVVLLKDGKSPFQIVLPDRYDNPGTEIHLMSAAKCLQKEFRAASGVTLPIRKESVMTKNQPGIFTGNTERTRRCGFDPASLQGFSYRIAVKDGDIFLAGNDYHGLHGKKKEGYSRYVLGSVKAIVVFMEDYLHTRFLMPGDAGISTPEIKSLELPGNLECSGTPRLNFASGRGQSMMYDYANNNYGSGAYKSYGGHSYYDAIPEKEYFKTHPEYFALLGGVRVGSGNHLCISNPGVQELVYREMRKELDAGAETVEVGQTDGYIPCECADCRKYGNTDDPGEKLWIFHRSLAERLLKERPGKKALLISYGPTANPPKTFDAFPENTMIEICHYSPEMFRKWRKYKGIQGFTVYVYNWGEYPQPGFTAKLSPEACTDQVRMFAENNIRGVYRCGFGELFGMEGPVYYLYGKLLENPEASPEVVLDDYYKSAFGKAAAPMRVFYNTLHQRLNACYAMNAASKNEFSDAMKGKRVLPENPRILLVFIYSPDMIDTLEKNLTRAEKMTSGPKVEQRLALVRKEFDYAKNLATILHLYNAYRLSPDKASFEKLASAIEARNAMIDSFYAENGRMKEIPGWPEIRFFGRSPKHIVNTNGTLGATLGAPFTWNTKFLREKNILPGSGAKNLSIARAEGMIETFDFLSGAWAKAEWHELNGIQLGVTAEKTRFKILYDNDNLYIGVESDLPDSRHIVPVGKDGPAWRTDSMEIVLDPFGNREKYYHFIYNPAADSTYDAAFGFVTDVLDPRYNKADPLWNGKWTYKTARKNNKWVSLFVVPFKTLGVETPSSGTRWTLNVGRESFVEKQPELSLWSPNLETMSFHDRDSFGEAVFE
ncbi:MAG: hypothetical protein BWY31_03624 [Lentisphaerae bacterium ADurb.Bin242]|nr:MAG: hypothetical protein BWY31_03624 [Lentisphaerae bacterium ADurb.Bin242]